MKKIYLGLGSNVGDREANLRAAVQRLQGPDLHVLRVSPVYETEPVGYADQRWFWNAVAEAETDLFPLQLLARAGQVERALGRRRSIPNGPRTIDIDVLLYGNTIMKSPSLEIPHPRIAERRFVLAPMSDLAPELRHPMLRRTVRELLDAAPQSAVRRIDVELP